MLVYISREKRPGYDHKKVGAMNALLRASAIISNGSFIPNLGCDHYIYNSQAIKEGMCFMMDNGGDKICFVQFPQRFEGIDPFDRYANQNIVFFDINMITLDGLQGPVYVGTGCLFRRIAFYGFDPPIVAFPSQQLDDLRDVKDRQAHGYMRNMSKQPVDATIIAEAIDAITCCECNDAFRGTASINLTDRLHQVLRWATGSVEIFFSRNNALLAGIKLQDWWRNEQFWLIGDTSSHIVAVLQGLLKVIAGIEISFTLTSKSSSEDENADFVDLYTIKWLFLMVPPVTIIILNLISIAFGVCRTIYGVNPQWGQLLGGVFFSFWVLAHLYPFAKGLMGRHERTPTVVYVWSGLIAVSICLLWVVTNRNSNT
ncbi:unnamed protein product [Dovyalis caffra]|uniref:Uncharacterized protein n=1 Tax=Dovyalis caffra TaxID=77055 RepID=A0AAV1STT4_9ROSI|nr:unnamed protein product [Dovyalis caffra]